MSVLFQNITAVLMDDGRTVLQNAYVAVEGGKIASVGTDKPAGEFDTVIDGTGKVLMPGFVNCHTHVPMTAMRGYGGGHNLQDWLNNFIFPAEDKWDDRGHCPGGAGRGGQRKPVGGRGVLRRPDQL